MVRRAVVDDRAATAYSESQVVERPSVASVIATVVTVLFVTAIGLIGLHALFEALDARESNGLVNAVETLASPLLAPFRGVFNDQSFWATALIAAVAYTVVYLIAMAILRRDRTT
jgi:MFS-type transporter involved in bile tolerance (Atg22 family)